MLHPKRTSLRRASFLVLSALVLAALVAGCGKKNEEQASDVPGAGQGQVIATYKGGEVSSGEFDKYTSFLEITDPQTAMYLQIPQFKEHFVKQFAMYKQYASLSTDEQKKAGDEQVAQFETQLNDAIAQNAELKDMIKEKNLTNDDMKKIVKLLATGAQIPQAKADEFLKAVTDDEIKAEYDKNPSDYNVVTVRHILVTTADPTTGEQTRTDEEALKRAQEVKGLLDKGGDWTALAKEYSDDGGSKDNGGLYEKQEARVWVAEFKEAANTQEIGKIGDPVQTQYGYHVMKVEAREETPFDKLAAEDKDELKNGIVDAKMQAFMEDEETKLDIQVTLPEEPSESPSAAPSDSAPASPGERQLKPEYFSGRIGSAITVSTEEALRIMRKASSASIDLRFANGYETG